MKKTWILLGCIFGTAAISFAASAQTSPQGPTPKQGCQIIDAHCICKNPEKDFKIENHKWGKTNPGAGEQGVCRTYLDIDEALKKAPILFCMSGEKVNRDPSKPQTSCTATWTCKKPCTY